jgi:alkaline phosphatase
MGGDFSRSGQQNMPFRGVDSSYTQRYCSSGTVVADADDNPTAILPSTPDELCDHYPAEDLMEIPKISTNVMKTLEFLAKDDDGFFLMYEQGDIDWAAHGNHMDDMLGAMLDIDESVKMIMEWIDANGGYEKNALYVTADHDHYLTLSDTFPEKLAMFLIAGESHMITPKNNSNVNPWDVAVTAGRHEDPNKTQIEHISDFNTWSAADVEAVGHFWGPRGSGGSGWGSHSTRPVPVFSGGDDGCLEKLTGANLRVLGKEVKGIPGKVDQVHLHACMLKALFGL